MIFKNRAEHPLSFSIGGKKYDVEIGGTCDVPDNLAYAVSHMGLPLDADLPKDADAHPGAETPAPKMRAGHTVNKSEILDAHAPPPLPDAPQPKRAAPPKEPDVADAHAPAPLPNDPPPKVRTHTVPAPAQVETSGYVATPDVKHRAGGFLPPPGDKKDEATLPHVAAPLPPTPSTWGDDDHHKAPAEPEEAEGRRKTTKR